MIIQIIQNKKKKKQRKLYKFSHLALFTGSDRNFFSF